MNIPLVNFYLGAPDIHGRTLKFIRSRSNGKLEACHDFIQWLFPLPTASAFNRYAPLLDDDTIDVFNTPVIQAEMLKSFKRMLRFYGFKWDKKAIAIQIYVSKREKDIRWISPNNHNYMRISRILRCLRLCGLETEAIKFHTALMKMNKMTGGKIPPNTLLHWNLAITGDDNEPQNSSPGNLCTSKARPNLG